jgi:hypothetical protein
VVIVGQPPVAGRVALPGFGQQSGHGVAEKSHQVSPQPVSVQPVTQQQYSQPVSKPYNPLPQHAPPQPVNSQHILPTSKLSNAPSQPSVLQKNSSLGFVGIRESSTDQPNPDMVPMLGISNSNKAIPVVTAVRRKSFTKKT